MAVFLRTGRRGDGRGVHDARIGRSENRRVARRSQPRGIHAYHSGSRQRTDKCGHHDYQSDLTVVACTTRELEDPKTGALLDEVSPEAYMHIIQVRVNVPTNAATTITNRVEIGR